jgi:hypothetical protein
MSASAKGSEAVLPPIIPMLHVFALSQMERAGSSLKMTDMTPQ